MRSKFALLIAIACFAGVVFMGASLAGAQVAGVNVPEALNCAVGVDDDGDGTLNQLDPDCGFIPEPPRSPSRSRFRSRAEPAPAPAPDDGGRDDGGGADTGGGATSGGGADDGGTGGNTAIGEQGPGGVSGNAGIDGATGENDEIDRDGPNRRRNRRQRGDRAPAGLHAGRRADDHQPDDDDRALRPGARRRPQLRHRLV